MIGRRILVLALTAYSALMLLSCGENGPHGKFAGFEIIGAGATFPEPLYKKWIEQFTRYHHDLIITYEGVGSGEGIKRFIRDEVDFGASDAAMNDEEIAKVDRGVKLIPATGGMIVLAYNLGNLNRELKLPRRVYVDIFSGKIRSWADPRIREANPGLNLPGIEIVPVVRQDASGTTFAFTNHLSAISDQWRNDGPGAAKIIAWPMNPMLARGNEGVAAKIRMSRGAMGYVEYGFAQRAELASAWLENKEGRFVKPNLERGRDTLADTEASMPQNMRLFISDPPGENSYPIVTYSWLLLYSQYPDAKKGSALKDFVTWGLKQGQSYAPDLGYCPLPSRVVERVEKALQEIDASSRSGQ